MANTHERFFLHCELNIGTHRDVGTPLAFASDGDEVDALSIIEKAWKGGGAKFELSENDWVKITDVTHYPSDKMVAILIRRGDPRASGQVFEDIDGNLRDSDKKDEEKVAVSVHLFIHTAPVGGFRYKAVLEESSNLGRSYVQKVLSLILSKFNYAYTNDKGKEGVTRPKIHLDGIRGEKLGQSAGTFDYIDLYREGEAPGLDAVGIVPRRQTMRLKIKSGTPHVVSQINAVRDWATGQGWTDVRVRLNLPGGRDRMIPLGRDADAADVLFSRAVLVTTVGRLRSCTDTINEELRGIAMKQFAEAKWG